MGKFVNYRTAPGREAAAGVRVVPLVDWFDGVEMMASVLRLENGARHQMAVPQGSDQYLFVLAGEARLEDMALAADDWLLLQEGRSFALEGAAEFLSVAAPPPGSGRAVPGFAGGLKRLRAGEQPVADVPAERKQRIYLANEALAGSKRGHAMIVRYTGETVTRRHHHPNAESLFVVLTGKVAFINAGATHVLARGEAAFFPANDSHGLKSADGAPLSFLEFHIPGAYATAYDE